MSFIEDVKAKAKAKMKTIVLPEAEDKRTLEAAQQIKKEGFAKLVLLGNKETVEKDAQSYGFDLSGIEIVDPKMSPSLDDYVATLVELRKSKGMTEEEARKLLTESNTYFGGRCRRSGFRRLPFYSRYTSPFSSDFKDQTGNKVGIRFLCYGCTGLSIWGKWNLCLLRLRVESESDSRRAGCNRRVFRRVFPLLGRKRA